MNIVRRALFVLSLFAVSTVGAAEWKMLPQGSRLGFFITYAGQEAPGLFHRFATELQFDPSAPAGGRLVVTVTVPSADLDSEDINAAIAGPEWFDFERFAEARFVSESIVGAGDGHFIATGPLRLKGIERVIEVPFSWSEAGGLAHMRGELTLQRTAFGIGTGEWAGSDVIGRKVRVRFDVALQRVHE